MRQEKPGFRKAPKCPKCKHFEFEHGMTGCFVKVGERACKCYLRQDDLAESRAKQSRRRVRVRG